MDNNSVSLKISQADWDKIQQAIQSLQSILQPHLVTLSSTERSQMPRMADKTVAFVQKSLDYAKTTPQLNPPYLNLTEMAIDIEAVSQLKQILNPLLQLIQPLEDTIVLSGSEAYSAALMYYGAIKEANKHNVLGAKVIYEDLAQRFPSRTKSVKNKQEVAPK